MDYNPFNSVRATQQTVQENKFLIPEEIPANERTAFMGAAAAAHKAGKSHFNFGGKKHAVTMKKDTAQAVNSDTQTEYSHIMSKKKHKATEGYYKDMEIRKQDKEMGAKPVPAKKKKMAKGGGKEGDVEMNPKMDTGGKTEQKESKIRSALKSVLNEKQHDDRKKHNPNEDDKEKMSDFYKGQGAKDMMKGAQDEIAKGPDAHLDEPEMIKKDRAKMTSNVKKSAMRRNDNPKGDSNIIPAGTPMKDPAAMKAESFGAKVNALGKAYASMYETKTEEIKEVKNAD
tara:strand:+ start:590 stop:1444 length:855 start_codon:yes stop_codon:yes gene_type:complete